MCSFSTKNRQPLIAPEIRSQAEAYLVEVLHELSCPSIGTKCQADHVHIICHLSRNCALADVIEEIKKRSSKWIKTKGPELESFFWQGGYGAFSVSPSNVKAVLKYLAAQDQHHKKVSFQDELRAFLRKHGVAFDERYLWD